MGTLSSGLDNFWTEVRPVKKTIAVKRGSVSSSTCNRHDTVAFQCQLKCNKTVTSNRQLQSFTSDKRKQCTVGEFISCIHLYIHLWIPFTPNRGDRFGVQVYIKYTVESKTIQYNTTGETCNKCRIGTRVKKITETLYNLLYKNS